MYKKVLSIALSLIIVIGFSSQVFAEELEKDTMKNSIEYNKNIDLDLPLEDDNKITIDSYENYLEQEDSKIELQQFKNLSEDKKEKLVKYLNDEELKKQLYANYFNSNSNFSMRNGDIQITSEKIEENTPKRNMVVASNRSVQYRKASYKRNVKIFGIKVFETTAWIKYSHNGKSILNIQGYNFLVSRNFDPLLDVDWSGQTSWKTNKTAYATSDISFSFIYDGLGMVMGSGEVAVWGDIYNQTGGNVKAY